MIIMECGEAGQPSIAQHHPVQIESDEVAEAKTAEEEENRYHRENRDVDRGGKYTAIVKRDDAEIIVVFRDVAKRYAERQRVDEQKWDQPMEKEFWRAVVLSPKAAFWCVRLYSNYARGE
jgi:hypothetical protein